MRTCVIVADSNQRIVKTKIFKETTRYFYFLVPIVYFKEVYEGEEKDLQGIQRYFDPENYALEIDLLQFVEDAKKLNLPTISKELESFVSQYKKINEIIEKILDVKKGCQRITRINDAK